MGARDAVFVLSVEPRKSTGAGSPLLLATPPDQDRTTCVGMPAGVLRARIARGLVDADRHSPAKPAALAFLTTTGSSFHSPAKAEFRADQGGRTAVSTTRWVNTQGEKGPWSEITTVAG